ncbi:hypothetical protein [Dyadobacter sandarakinus]|uniref:Lipocalin-like domain-containing protein n=1 Tax=Dyadobacter sandarakinus TaxID=2747268 RepID=A0ABX7I3R6_9BACT|nr:hypothetical protein [Dyadobacter sandarakinus]QRR00721.1 hypothetical protein HWI92_07285 [Dyadobacter sandarakinus]
MTYHKYLFLTVLSMLVLGGCQDSKRKQELDLREQRLLQKEKEFSLKEADYRSLVRMRDSLFTKTDTAAVVLQWPDDIAGTWNGKSLCRESTCPEYVIGDQRSNSWEFISDSTGLYTRVTNNNNQVIRVYSATFDSTRIQLHFASDSSASKNMELAVELGRSGANLLKGLQTIGIDKSCAAKFSIELTRSLNQ